MFLAEVPGIPTADDADVLSEPRRSPNALRYIRQRDVRHSAISEALRPWRTAVLIMFEVH